MSTSQTINRISISIAVVALGLAFYFYSENHQSTEALKAARQQQPELQIKIDQLETRLTLATDQLHAAEKEADTLRLDLEKASTPQPPSTAPHEPITQSYVDARYKKARELAKAGNHSEALKEFLWCYDVGMRQVTSYSGVRYSFLLSEIVRLGDKYPPALDALRARRDQAEKRLITNASDFDTAQGFSSINKALAETGRTLAYYDQLPPDAPGKQLISMLVYDELASAQRYQEAAQAKPYKRMASFFEDVAEMPQLPSTTPGLESIRSEHRAHATKLGAGFVEVLAGAGQLEDARDLAQLITAYDNSPEARTALDTAAAKAGHANLFSQPATR